MVNYLFLLTIICLVSIFFVFLIIQDTNLDQTYQGPVPEGYDLEHYRKTGETIKSNEEINNG